MKMRLVDRPAEEFEAEIVIDHPESVPGPFALRRKDTGEYISVADCFGLSGVPSKWKKYDIMEATVAEHAQFEAFGILLF